MPKIIIPASVNEKTTLAVTSGQTLVLSFEPTAAKFERNESDLTIAPQGGQQIVLSGFFAVGDNDLPDIQLATGEELNAKDFLTMVAPDMDIATAAGTSSPPSSSGGQYEDGAGDLIGGVDRLGSLGTTQWSVNSEASPLETAFGMSTAGAGGPGEGGGETPGAGGGDGRMLFNTRAVLYAHDAINDPAGHTNHYVTAAALTVNSGSWEPTGDATGVSVSYRGGDSAAYLAAPVVNADGTITFVLTPEALAYFAATPNANPLEFYYTITAGGVSYTVQVVVPYSESSFDSGWYDNNAKYGRLDGELIYGESHKGHSNSETGYNVVSSNKIDELLFEGDLTGSDIKTGYDASGDWGDDKVTVDGGMIATGTAPDGANGNNSIVTGNGADTVTVTGGMRAEQTAGNSDDASNTVDTGNNDGDSVRVDGGIYAVNGDSANSISSTHVTITASGDVVEINDWLSAERLVQGDPYNEVAYPEHHLNQNGLSALNQEGYGVTSNTLEARDQVVITVRGGAMSAGIATEALFGGEANNTITVSGSNEQWAVDIQSGTLGDDNLAMGVYTRGPGATTIIDATNDHADQDMSGIRIVARNGGTGRPNVDLGGLAGGLLTSAVTTTGLLPYDGSAYPIPDDQPNALTKITASGNIKLLAESDGLREVATVATHQRATTEIISTNSDISVEAKGIVAYALSTSGVDSKTIFTAENGSVLLGAYGASAHAANVPGDLTITAGKNITIEAVSDQGVDGYGLHVMTPTDNAINLTAGDLLSIQATGALWSYAALFQGGTHSLSGKDVEILAQSKGGNAALALGLSNHGNSELAVEATAGSVTITAEGGEDTTTALVTGSGSSSTIKAADNINITAMGGGSGIGYSSSVNAVVSDHTSTTILDAKGDVILKAVNTSASPTYGITTDNNSDANIWATGTIDITAQGGTSASGVSGDNLSITVLNTSGDNSDIIINAISGKTQYDGTAIDGGGIRMDNGSDAFITAEKGDIRINAEGMNAAGVSADHSSTVNLSAEEIHITGKGEAYGVGIEAEQGPYNGFSSRVEARAQGDIVITAESEASAIGAYTGEPYNGGSILIESQQGDIRIAAHGLTDASGNIVTEAAMASGTTNNVSVIARDGDIDISARASYIAHGVYGNATIEAMGHAIDITGKSVSGPGYGSANGVTTQFGKSTIRTADVHDAVLAGNITILADASEGGVLAHGVSVLDDLEVTTGSLNITATAGTDAGSSAFGIKTYNASFNTPKGEFTANDITVTASSSVGAAHGVFAGHNSSNVGDYCSGENVLTARSGNITVTATGAVANTPTSAYAAAGIYTYWGSTTTLKTENGDITVTATGAANGSGIVGALVTDHESTTMLDAKGDVILKAVGNSVDTTYGVTTGNDSTTDIRATGNIDIIAEGGATTYGVSSQGLSFATGIEAGGSLDITAASSLGHAVGIAGSVMIKSSDVTIKAVSNLPLIDGSSAIGVEAGSGDINVITGVNTRESITVTITAKAGSFDGIALLAKDSGAILILGGAGADRVEINGAIKAENGGRNIIDTRSGNDIIRLNGQVNDASLEIQAGDGYDVLVLSASTAQEFTILYAAWLFNLTDDQLRAMSIESFRISSGLDPNDLAMSWFTGFITRYEDITGITPVVQWDTVLDDGSIASYTPAADTGYDVHVSGATLADAHDTLTLGAGDDWVRVDGDLVSGLDLGDGHNNLRVDGSIASSAEVLMGADEDVLTVNGGIIGGVVDMGAGDDTLDVKGGVTGGSITMGDGNDSAAISGGVSNAAIDMGDGDNYLHLSGPVTDSTIEAGSGDSLLHYSFNGNAGDIISLLDNDISGFSSLVLDMTDDKASALNLDDLLDDLFAAKQNNTDIYIRGDAEDSLNLTGWTADPSANVQGSDGYAYEAYTYADNGDTLTIYVQSQIQTG